MEKRLKEYADIEQGSKNNFGASSMSMVSGVNSTIASTQNSMGFIDETASYLSMRRSHSNTPLRTSQRSNLQHNSRGIDIRRSAATNSGVANSLLVNSSRTNNSRRSSIRAESAVESRYYRTRGHAAENEIRLSEYSNIGNNGNNNNNNNSIRPVDYSITHTEKNHVDINNPKDVGTAATQSRVSGVGSTTGLGTSAIGTHLITSKTSEVTKIKDYNETKFSPQAQHTFTVENTQSNGKDMNESQPLSSYALLPKGLKPFFTNSRGFYVVQRDFVNTDKAVTEQDIYKEMKLDKALRPNQDGSSQHHINLDKLEVNPFALSVSGARRNSQNNKASRAESASASLTYIRAQAHSGRRLESYDLGNRNNTTGAQNNFQPQAESMLQKTPVPVLQFSRWNKKVVLGEKLSNP